MRLNEILSVLSTGLSAVAVARLVHQRLITKTPFVAFGCMLVVGLVRDITLRLVPYETHEYALTWEWSLGPLLLTHCWAALSAYSRVVGLYPKIGRFAVWLFVSCLALAVIGCCAITPFEMPRIIGGELLLRTLFLLYRWVDTVCAGALLFAILFLSRFPSPMKRRPGNVLIHLFLITAYMGSNAVTYYVENLVPLGGVIWIESIHLVTICTAYCGWVFFVSSAGEVGDPWPKLDPVVVAYIHRRYQAVLSMLRWAAR